MKKMFGVSLGAVLAALPLVAQAADPQYTGAPTAASAASETIQSAVNAAANTTPNPLYALVDNQKTNNIASTSYVKGAYNAAINAVNKTYNVLDAAKQDAIKAGNSAIDTAVATEVRDADTLSSDTGAPKLVTEAAVRSAVDSALTSVSGDYATKTGVVATINKSTTSTTVTVSDTWGDDSSTQTVDFAGTVAAPDNNKYYPTYSATGTAIETMTNGYSGS